MLEIVFISRNISIQRKSIFRPIESGDSVNCLNWLTCDLSRVSSSVISERSADRSDITEELTRLKSHVSQFKQFTESPDSIGRKMDFLCIEMFREMNTISSKTQQIEVTKNIIEGKNELERIREQVQNIE